MTSDIFALDLQPNTKQFKCIETSQSAIVIVAVDHIVGPVYVVLTFDVDVLYAQHPINNYWLREFNYLKADALYRAFISTFYLKANNRASAKGEKTAETPAISLNTSKRE